MSETPIEATPDAPEGAQEATEAPVGGAQPVEQKQGVESLPEWAQKVIRDARSEAGNYRTQLRAAEENLGKAKTQEEFEAARAELQQENAKLILQLAQRDAATAAGLPASMAGRLQGSTPEELSADAQALAALIGKSTGPTVEPIQGPGGGGLSGDADESLGDLAGKSPRELADEIRMLQRIR